MWKYLRFKLRRKTRRIRYHLHLWRIWLLNYFDRHVYGGWQKLGNMRGTMLAWLGLVLICFWGLMLNIGQLDHYYLTQAPARGGNYSEGVSGELHTMNPIFADNTTSADLSSLIFSGLTKLDSKGNYTGDVADHWDISADKKTYTFYLRPNTRWQDGARLTANDVAFTINSIQNPDTRSPLASDWKGVVTTVVDDTTIRFSLPNSYSEFLYNTTVGILPKHLLGNVKPSLLRLHEFGQKPIGSGPYEYVSGSASTAVIALKANPDFYLGEPYIPTMQVRIYPTNHDEITAYERKEIMGISRIDPVDFSTLSKIESLNIYQLKQPAYVAAFFNFKNPILGQPQFRQALAHATDRNAIISQVLQNQALRSQLPLPAGFSGFTPTATQYDYNTDTARSLLAATGAQTKPLDLVTLKDSVYAQVAEQLKKQWEPLGVKLNVVAVDSDSLQQDYIRPRNYDILLYGQNLGVGSDEYSFWHSSQTADPGLNVSNYKNADVDRFLEAGRIARDPDYKASRYNGFLEAWSKDEPAIILYSPYYDYAQSTMVHGFDLERIVQPQDRFNNVYQWYIKTKDALKARL